MAKADTTTSERSTRKRVDLPQSIPSEEATWPVSTGRTSRNSALREQIAADLESMEVDSVRKYDIAGDREQKAFANQFRSVLEAVYGDTYGVKVALTESAVYVKLTA